MTFKPLPLLLGLVTAFGWIIPLAAQPAAAPAQGTVKFRMIGWNGSINLYYKAGGKQKPVYAKQGVPSPVQTYTGKIPIEFYGYEAPAAGQSAKTPVANVDFEKETGALLLVFVRNADDTYTVLPLPDREDSLSPDQTRVYNGGDALVGVELGGEVFQLKPGEAKIVPSKGSTVCMKAAQDKNGKWTDLILEYLDYEPGARTTVIISSPKRVHFKLPVGYPPLPPLILLTIATPAEPKAT